MNAMISIACLMVTNHDRASGVRAATAVELLELRERCFREAVFALCWFGGGEERTLLRAPGVRSI